MNIENLQAQKEKLFNEREELIEALKAELSKDIVSDILEIETRIRIGWNSLTIEIKDSKSTWEFAEISYRIDFDKKDLPWKIEFNIKGYLADGTATEKYQKSLKIMEYIRNILSDDFKTNYFDKYRENSVEIENIHAEIVELKQEVEATRFKKEI